MRWRIEPWMADVIVESQDKCFASLSNDFGIEGVGAKLGDEMGEHRFEQRTAWSILRNDIFIYLRDDGADDIFRRLIVISHASQHLQITDDQCLLHIVRHLPIPQLGI